MYRYETHLHTFPVSRCALADVESSLMFYKNSMYDGVFITNHFLDGNVNINGNNYAYEDGIDFYFSDYEKGVKIGEKLGIKVFCGVELTYKGTDFLVYGLDKQWFLDHPEIMSMKKSDELKFMIENGALVIQAHPFRQAQYIDHIRLFPAEVHGVEVINASRTKLENDMAKIYAEKYNLIEFAGSDNHVGAMVEKIAGVSFDEPILDEQDFVQRVKSGKAKLFAQID